MSETQEAVKAKKVPTPVTEVTLSDGRVVGFAGKRKMVKNYEIVDGAIALTFDFVNGETRKATIDASDPLLLKFAAHGAVQKIGDETAGEEDVSDMVVSVDAMLERLTKGEWGAERKAGDGFSGASVVVKAIMEASGKDQAFVKAFLEKKLEAGKESGLTRQKLYASFRAPGTKTAPIIERLEKEKTQAAPALNADEALGELMA